MFWREGFRVLEEGGRRGRAGEGRERVITASPTASLREMMLWKASSS